MRFLTLLSLVLLFGSFSAQTFEGKITFGIDYELPEFITKFIEEIQINTNLIMKDKRFKDIIDYEAGK